MSKRIILNETSYFGKGAIKEIINELQSRHFQKILVTTGEDLLEFGVATKVTDLLRDAGINFEVYTDIKPNPTIENIKNGVDVCKRFDAQAIVAIGGGSIIDASKAIGIIMTNPEFSDVRSLEGLAETKNKSLPIIAVSTTAGTAAEVTINYVITDVEKKRKFVCVDPHDIPVVAIVDPDMSASMPKGLCASTGMGFSNVGLGIVHSMAHPLSALYDVPHGKACAMMLTAVLKYNASATGNKYKEIARAFGVQNLEQMSKAEADSAAIAAIQQLADDVNIPKHLKAVGVKEEDLEFLAKSAMEDACTPGNPKDPTLKDIISIYKSIM